MNRVHALIREQTIAECINAVWPIMGEHEDPGEVARQMLAALKRLQSPAPVVVTDDARIDYLEQVQEAARAMHAGTYARDQIGPDYRATATVPTPLGALQCVTWLRQWTGAKRARVTWASEYTLAGEFVSVREIKALGLARRPTTRNRRKRSDDL